MKFTIYEPYTINAFREFMESTTYAKTPSQIRALFKMEKYFVSDICKELLRSRIRELILSSVDRLDIELYEELLSDIDTKSEQVEEIRKVVRYDEVNGMVYNGKKKKPEVSPTPPLVVIKPPKVEVIKVYVKEKVEIKKQLTVNMIVASLRLYKGSEEKAAEYCGVSLKELKYWVGRYKIKRFVKNSLDASV